MRRPRVLLAALASAALQAASPRASAVGDEAGTLRFETGGRRVTIDVARPAGPGRRPVVLLLHGRAGLALYAAPFARLAAALVDRGFVVLTPHYFEASGSGAAPEVTRGRFETWRTAVADALAFASRQPGVDAQRMGVVGVSLGGFLAAVEAVQDSRVAALVAQSAGVSTWFPAGPLRMPPLLIVHARGDPVAPLAGALRLAGIARALGVEPELALLDGSEHVPTGAAEATARARILTFLDATLGPGRPAP